MQKILTAAEMREVDRLTTEKYGIPSIILMENAAHAAANVIKDKLGGSVAGKSFLILCGKGNNGGDGAALARILAVQGAWLDVVLFGNVEETKGDAKVNFQICQKLAKEEETANLISDHHDIFRFPKLFESDGAISFYEVNSREDFDDLLYGQFDQEWDVLVDAVFGTGLTKPLEGWLSQVNHHLNILNDTQRYLKRKCLLVSIDIPTGLNADVSEQIGGNSQSDLTVTFTAPKLANVLPPASNFNGELIVANIGSPQELIDNSPSQTFLSEKADAINWIEKTKYTDNSYKNKRGHALLVVGSKEYTGAGILAGNAAMLSGVGLVTIATSESAQTAIAAKVLEEVITRTLPEDENGVIAVEAFERIEKLAEKVDVVGIGSGLGVQIPNSKFQIPNSKFQKTKSLVEKVVEDRRTPIVIDADGLNALSPFALKGSDELPLILTPHEGEFLRLLGTDDKDALKDRIAVVREFAQKHHVILVLKGERTLIASPDGRVVINPTGNSGLGKAGNGDTLTGIIAGFVAQSMKAEKDSSFYTPVADPKIFDVFNAVVAAVYIAGLAGDIAAEKFGKRSMLASDVRACLREAFERITDN